MATPPQGPAASSNEPPIGGANSRLRSDVKSSLRIDTGQLNKLNEALKQAKETTKQWRIEMEKLAKAASSVHASITGVAGGGGKGGAFSPAVPGTDGEDVNSSKKPGQEKSATAQALTGSQRFAAGVAAAAPIIGGLTRQLDQRIDRGIAYSTSADRLNMLTQQMTGLSQQQVIQNMRRPLTDYKLGAGGVNAIMAFQASTGIQATPGMAQSIAAIRASTGFTKSTQDILTEQRQLMDPTVANRMFMMGGVNAFNIGGGMKDPLQMRQEIVKRMGLDNPAIARSALAPGSVTRARMADLGLGEEMQTEILQYAQQQIQFREKGGKGFYDPSKREDRARMGVEDNLATQQEETQRVSDLREERFMERQIDNMAALERSNQALIKAMTSLEDTMSGVIGARTSTRAGARIAGSALKGVGAGLLGAAALNVWNPGGWGLALAGGAMMLGSAMAGDPPDPDAEGNVSAGVPRSKSKSSAHDSQIHVPYGYNGNRISISELKNKADFQKLNPRFKSRLLQMMRVNPNVGVGGGTRDSAAQEAMFRSRYEPTTEVTNIFWEGKYWKHVSGAAAAPPGMSMHEIGLAADLVGDLDWMNAHAAEFGLKHFAGVNNEPWHVQPSDLPNSRAKYESQGAPWGTDGNFNREASKGSGPGGRVGIVGDGTHTEVFDEGKESSREHINKKGLWGQADTISDRMDKSRQSSMTRFMTSKGGAPNPNGHGPNFQRRGGRGGRPLPPPSPGALSGAEVARLAYNAKFRGKDLAAVVAIAYRESRWKPGAYNPNRATKDDSYGLMQINMLGDLGPARLQQFGISRNEELYDPQTNMDAAYVLYQRSGNTLHPWGGYKGKSNTYGTDLSLGEQAVREAGLEKELSGDPTDFLKAPTRSGATNGGSSGGTMHVTSSPTINVAPVINFNGTPSTPDLRNIAQVVSRMIKAEVDMLDMRTA